MTQNPASPPTRRLRRTGAVAALAAAALAASAVPATADTIAYSGSDGNIWITDPGGARKIKVTSDGGTAAGTEYRNPTQTNDGRILTTRERFFFLLRQDGTNATAPWQAPTGGSYYKSPLNAQIAPSGGTVVWSYIHNIDVFATPFQRVSFQTPDGGTPGPCTINCHDGYTDPRWIPGTPYAGMINTARDVIAVQQAGSSQPVAWGRTNDSSFAGFDVSRTGNRTLIISTPTGSGTNKQGVVELFQGSGAPPAGGTLVCSGPLGNENSQPRWSPDGTKFTYADSQGVWVATAPVRAANGSCIINKTLIAPGGESPDFGPANLPAAPDPGTGGGGGGTPPGGGGGGGGGTPPAGGGGGGVTPPADGGGGGGTPPGDGSQIGGEVTPPSDNKPPADVIAPAIAKLVLGKGKLAKLLSSGYSVSFTPNEGGAATMELLSGKTVVASGRGTVRSGAKATLKAKFTKKARAALKRKKSVKLTLRITVKDAAGNAGTQTKRVTLKR
jgi:hypothetical protein